MLQFDFLSFVTILKRKKNCAGIFFVITVTTVTNVTNVYSVTTVTNVYSVTTVTTFTTVTTATTVTALSFLRPHGGKGGGRPMRGQDLICDLRANDIATL